METKQRTKKEQGRLGRARGKAFELKVRHEMESKDLVVCKWTNQIDFEKNKVIPAKVKFNPFTKSSSQGNGFPDFVVYTKRRNCDTKVIVVGVESKMNKYLSPDEKKMCDWLLANNIFVKILIAYKKDKEIFYYDYFTNNDDFTEIGEAIDYE